jgi:hypothetical protein
MEKSHPAVIQKFLDREHQTIEDDLPDGRDGECDLDRRSSVDS